VKVICGDTHLENLGDEGFNHPNKAVPVLLEMYRILGGMAIFENEDHQAAAIEEVICLLKERLDELTCPTIEEVTK